MEPQGQLLFGENQQPLAARLRPSSLSDFCGQQHLLGKNSALRIALKGDEIPSMILWGPPGTGKTTLAHIISKATQRRFLTLSAVTDGVKDIRRVVSEAREFASAGDKTVLFIDEVHRFNKSQQDALLPYIEQGLFVFIGATTENPSFEINNALLSRVNVYRLELLDAEAIKKILWRAIQQPETDFSKEEFAVEAEHIDLIASACNGDARRALIILENVIQVIKTNHLKCLSISLIEGVLSDQSVHFDKGGDHFFDQISALHKAVRGSSSDASLYWLARMLCGGCDPFYIARRLVRIATEDVGLADPRALRVALDSWEMLERLGSPEGELGLAQATLYLAVAPKSHAVYQAMNAAKNLAQTFGSETVPLHLRNASTKLAKEAGHGASYHYAHDYEGHYVPGESYLPEKIHKEKLYIPSDQGLEKTIQSRLDHWAALNSQGEFRRYSK